MSEVCLQIFRASFAFKGALQDLKFLRFTSSSGECWVQYEKHEVVGLNIFGTDGSRLFYFMNYERFLFGLLIV